jgi:hypothetical protein
VSRFPSRKQMICLQKSRSCSICQIAVRWIYNKESSTTPLTAFARLRVGEVNKESSTTPLTVFHRHDLVFCSEPITSLIIICLDKGRDEWFDTWCLVFSISTVHVWEKKQIILLFLFKNSCFLDLTWSLSCLEINIIEGD